MKTLLFGLIIFVGLVNSQFVYGFLGGSVVDFRALPKVEDFLEMQRFEKNAVPELSGKILKISYDTLDASLSWVPNTSGGTPGFLFDSLGRVIQNISFRGDSTLVFNKWEYEGNKAIKRWFDSKGGVLLKDFVLFTRDTIDGTVSVLKQVSHDGIISADSSRISFVFDSSNRILEATENRYYLYDPTSSYRSVYTYTSAGELATSSDEYWDFRQWIPTKKVQYVDSDSGVTKMQYGVLSGSNDPLLLIAESRTDYRKPKADSVHRQLFYSKYGPNSWICNQTMSYRFDASRRIEYAMSKYGTSLEGSREKYFYNSNGLIDSVVMGFSEDSTDWRPYQRTVYTNQKSATEKGLKPELRMKSSLTVSPNPFNPVTKLRFNLGQTQAARLTIHDVTGRNVREWKWSSLNLAPQQVSWDGKDNQGNSLASGLYFAVLKSGANTERAVLSLMK